ncbi:SRPBCC domain-containing protein [Alteribacillus sp. HJP-4]|uniref:SRPBCC domain-containing protein n=1 Tax=Alteribacillus sp. HJP-4 TaxID=2775394 RepID=UPI0035CCDA6F
MSNYGTLQKKNSRCALRFERFFSQNREEIFHAIINPASFTQWYPFATGEMDVKPGGKIHFDDGEGSVYEGVITEIEEPYIFSFRELEDMVEMTVTEVEEGCCMVFTHTFDDEDMAVYIAAGWHRCLDVFEQIVNDQPIKWPVNAEVLREYYRAAFESN